MRKYFAEKARSSCGRFLRLADAEAEAHHIFERSDSFVSGLRRDTLQP